MKPSEESPTNGIELAVETLAVAFSECKERRSVGDNRRLSIASAHRGGKSLFRKFVRENSNSVWKPQLVKSLSAVRFGGYLQEPPTILLQGDSDMLQHIRDAWSSRLLRPPAGYHIDFVGDVTRIGARPLTRGRFVPLNDAVCISIGNVGSRDEVATQEAILSEIERSFPDVDSPTRELLHETLGKLIRNRKVFCTGRGYHLVTTKTYSGKMANRSEDDGSKTKVSFAQGCEACQENRATAEEPVKGRHSSRSWKRPEDPELLSKSRIQDDNLHGSVLPHTMNETQQQSGDSSSPSPKKSMHPDRRSSIVGKVADKLFRRRRKSSSERRRSESATPSSPIHNEINPPVREFSKEEARRLGYETQVPKHRNNSNNKESLPDRSGPDESPLKQSSSSGSKVRDRPDSIKPDSSTGTRISNSEQVSDSITKKHNRVGLRKSHSERRHVKQYGAKPLPKSRSKLDSLKSPSGNNRFPELRDVAVSCNLEVEEVEQTDENVPVTSPAGRVKSPTLDVTPSLRERRLPRRSKSLRLPRERRTLDYDSPSDVFSTEHAKRYPPPDYNTVRRSETSQGITYDSLQNSTDEGKTRRSISSSSTGKEYSYLHACHFAPSVRVGSVIADHLEELDRRRHYWMFNSSREMSPASSVLSSTIPVEASVEPEPKYHDDSMRSSNLEGEYYDESKTLSRHEREYLDRNLTMPNDGNIPEDNTSVEQDDQESEESLDAETKAALQVAKRLAQLDIKMTRQEWKDYFAEKVLPSHVEEALRGANEKESDFQQASPSTCFANTSGSVETVIDLRDNFKSHRSRLSDGTSRSSTASDKYAKNRTSSDAHETDFYAEEYGSLRSTETARSNDTNNNFEKKRDSKHWVEQEDHPVLYRCPDLNFEEDYEPQVFYTCDLGHRHLPYSEKQRQVVALDSASLTEDSGFHSSRERSSLSSWRNRKKPRGTFV